MDDFITKEKAYSTLNGLTNGGHDGAMIQCLPAACHAVSLAGGAQRSARSFSKSSPCMATLEGVHGDDGYNLQD